MKEIAIISCPGLGSVDDCLHLARQFTATCSSRDQVHCTVFGCLASSKVQKYEAKTERAYVIRLMEEEDWRVGPYQLVRPEVEPPHVLVTTQDSEMDEPQTEATTHDFSESPSADDRIWTKSPKDFLLDVLRATKVLELTDYIDLVILEVKYEDYESLVKLYNAIHGANAGWSRRMIIYFLRRSDHAMEGINVKDLATASDPKSPSKTIVRLKRLEVPALVIGDSFVCADLPVAKYYNAQCWSFHPNSSWYGIANSHLVEQTGLHENLADPTSLACLLTAFRRSIKSRAGVLTWTVPSQLDDFKNCVQIQFQTIKELDNNANVDLLRVNCHVGKDLSFVASVKASATLFELDLAKAQKAEAVLTKLLSVNFTGGAGESPPLYPYISGQEPTTEFGQGLLCNCNSFADVLTYPIIATPTSPLELCNSRGLTALEQTPSVTALAPPPALWRSKLGGISVKDFLHEYL